MRAKADLFLLCALCVFSVVDSAPTFTKEPRVQNPVEGNNITLEWSYNFGDGSYRHVMFGSDDISLIVEKSFSDSVPYIAPAFSGRLLANVTDIYTSITFLRVNRNDSNSYTLTIVSNSRESVDSKLEISAQYPPEIDVHPEAGPKTEGKNVVLSCDAKGNPEPTISWTRDGSPVDSSDSSRISFSVEKKQLRITNLNRTDSGEYRCVANNNLGNATSNAATLDVQCENYVQCVFCRIALEFKHGLSTGII